MNAYTKMQNLLGFEPSSAHEVDIVDDTESMMEIIHESRINSAISEFMSVNKDIELVYNKMRDMNYDLEEIKNTHMRLYPMTNSILSVWDKLYTLSKIAHAMFINFDNVDDLFFLSENQVMIGMEFINLCHAERNIEAMGWMMRNVLVDCRPIPLLPMDQVVPAMPALPVMPEMPEMPVMPENLNMPVAPNAPRRAPPPLLPRAEMFPRQLFN